MIKKATAIPIISELLVEAGVPPLIQYTALAESFTGFHHFLQFANDWGNSNDCAATTIWCDGMKVFLGLKARNVIAQAAASAAIGCS